MDDALRDRLERVYARHPVSADAVLARVRAERGTLDGLTARELAEDSHGGVTDQNHIGGAASVRAIAAAVELRDGWSVLDIGTGLGGTPRLLAAEFGCRSHGVELTTSRYLDAVRLTALVGLQDRVTFSHGDFMTVTVPDGLYDLAIGQGSFMHFPDAGGLLRRIAAHLRPGGRLVMEDGVVLSPPAAAEAAMIERLLDHWNGRFRHRADWPRMLAAAGFALDRTDDLSALAAEEFEALLREVREGRLRNVSDDEREGWELGLQLLRSGHLGMVRLVGTARGLGK